MNFRQAVASGFSNYVKFAGRAVRSEYWYWILFVSIVGLAAAALDLAFVHHRHGPIESIWQLVTFLPGLAVAVRRLHDTDRSGGSLLAIFAAMVLIGLIFILTGFFMLPIVFALICMFVLIYWFCQPGTPGPNRFGPDPFGPLGHITPRPTV
jgi:uncharacterized membrane protein YhaH (DUF805 family)